MLLVKKKKLLVEKMKIRFIIPGKDKKGFLSLGYKDYLTKISKYSKVSIEYVYEKSYLSIPSEKEIEDGLIKEGENILKLITDKEFVFLIDIHSSELDTLSFARLLKDTYSINGNIVFVFGSSYGLSPLLRKRANYSLSLSRLTFTHYEALLITLEQVYRAFKINNNEVYDK